MIKVQVYGYTYGGKALARRIENTHRFYLNVEQLQVPDEYKALEILYG